MPRRKSLVKVSFRLEKDTLGRLERAAKQRDRSLNDEITHRLEDSVAFDVWREKREKILEKMRRKLERQLKQTPSRKEPEQVKPRGSRSVQVQFRLREEILTELEHQAKYHGHSTHDEIGIRLEWSFDAQDPWEELLPLISALIDDVASLDKPEKTIAAFAKMDWEAERDLQEQMRELFRPRRIHVRTERPARAMPKRRASAP
jgi:hypothetical protein